jgi:hypothetical protein
MQDGRSDAGAARRAARAGRAAMLAGLSAALLAAAGCGDWPRDPEGTLERARGGVLRAGAAEAAPVIVRGADGAPDGPEAELVEAFAASIGARVEWRWGSADELLRALEQRELDVAAVGLTAKTPWKAHVGVTRPWLKREGEEHVLAVAAGENATLVALDRVIESRRTR